MAAGQTSLTIGLSPRYVILPSYLSVLSPKANFLIRNFISYNQHGFLPGRSTTTNLVVFSKHCLEAFERRCQVDAVYTDFSKAFDKVCHAALLAKLFRLGVHSSMLSWLESYLADRPCHVPIGDATSSPFIASSGLPQGSSLGPLLFIIFINDISSCFLYSDFLLYADDLKVFKAISCIRDSYLLQDDLRRVSSWCALNLLPLNLAKCHFIRYSKRALDLCTSYAIGNHDLQLKEEVVDLGVLLTQI